MDDTQRRMHERLDIHAERIARLETDVSWIRGVPADLAEIKSQLQAVASRLEAQGIAARARSTGLSGHIGLLQALVLLVVGGLVGAGVKALGG